MQQQKKSRGGRTQINKIRNEKGKVTTNTTETQRIITDYYKHLYANKMENPEEIDKFLERYDLLRLNEEEIENMNRLITSIEIETMIKNSQQTKPKVSRRKEIIKIRA